MESENVQRVPGHLPPRGAAAELHRAPGGDGEQLGHPRVAEAAARGLARSHPPSPGENGKGFIASYLPEAVFRTSSNCEHKIFYCMVLIGFL